MTEKQIETLINDIKGSITKLHDQVLTLERHVRGENPVGDVMKFFDEKWMSLYTHGMAPAVHYEFNRKVDPAQIKRLVNQVGSATEMKARLTRYFADNDLFLRKNRHPLNLFISRLNTYAPQGKTVAEEFDMVPATPSDCRHSPLCRDDVQHTMRKQREMRA